MIHALMQFDGNVLLFFQNVVRNDFLTPFFVVVTRLGDAGAVWIAISLVLTFNKKTRMVGIMGIIALVLSFLINNLVLKNLFARRRPFDVIDGLIPLIERPTDYSFPSGHTAASFAAAELFFGKLPKKAGVPMLILAILIAVSRMYLGVHYPSDIVGGIAGGILAGILSENLVNIVCGRLARGSDNQKADI